MSNEKIVNPRREDRRWIRKLTGSLRSKRETVPKSKKPEEGGTMGKVVEKNQEEPITNQTRAIPKGKPKGGPGGKKEGEELYQSDTSGQVENTKVKAEEPLRNSAKWPSKLARLSPRKGA